MLDVPFTEADSKNICAMIFECLLETSLSAMEDTVDALFRTGTWVTVRAAYRVKADQAAFRKAAQDNEWIQQKFIMDAFGDKEILDQFAPLIFEFAYFKRMRTHHLEDLLKHYRPRPQEIWLRADEFLPHIELAYIECVLSGYMARRLLIDGVPQSTLSLQWRRLFKDSIFNAADPESPVMICVLQKHPELLSEDIIEKLSIDSLRELVIPEDLRAFTAVRVIRHHSGLTELLTDLLAAPWRTQLPFDDVLYNLGFANHTNVYITSRVCDLLSDDSIRFAFLRKLVEKLTVSMEPQQNKMTTPSMIASIEPRPSKQATPPMTASMELRQCTKFEEWIEESDI